LSWCLRHGLRNRETQEKDRTSDKRLRISKDLKQVSGVNSRTECSRIRRRLGGVGLWMPYQGIWNSKAQYYIWHLRVEGKGKGNESESTISKCITTIQNVQTEGITICTENC
jgi:hypothetical protein